MNMITILLGSTGLLLVVAIVLSFNAMNDRTDEDEVRKLKREIAALRAADQAAPQQNILSTQPLVPSIPAPTPVMPAPQPQPQPSPSIASQSPVPPEPGFPGTPADDGAPAPEPGSDEEISGLLEEIEQAEREHVANQLRAENARLNQENEVLKNEAGVFWQSEFAHASKNAARAKTIQEALLVAQVTQYDEENGFAVADIFHPDSAQVGAVLAIRRRTGIYGQVKVDYHYPGSQVIVNPQPETFLGDEGIDIQPGDELIVPPL